MESLDSNERKRASVGSEKEEKNLNVLKKPVVGLNDLELTSEEAHPLTR